LNDDALLRYSRHILLNDFGIDGQERVANSHVLLIGAGGLGCAAALYLGSSGVGRITVIDPDTVDLTNLQRQIAHTMSSLGRRKVESLQYSLMQLNPTVSVHPLPIRADAALMSHWVPQADVVLDCSDNFSSRQLVNAACVRHGKPLVSGAALRFDGQVTVIDPRSYDAPCYACMFAPQESFEETQCAAMGVWAPLVGMVGSLQASEALKLLSGLGQPLTGRLLLMDALRMSWSEIRIKRQPDCPICQQRPLKRLGKPI
jgi:molybdopterin/thiamine biosynthesis adenylyltransferase